jgi:hypothetical protein
VAVTLTLTDTYVLITYPFNVTRAHGQSQSALGTRGTLRDRCFTARLFSAHALPALPAPNFARATVSLPALSDSLRPSLRTTQRFGYIQAP